MEIGLGTVQFGLDYGISNANGRTPFEDVVAILREASAAGVRLLDTAAAYGTSEEVLGRAMDEAGDSFRVVTKTKPQAAAVLGAAEIADVEKSFENSLRLLKRDVVDGLLVHHAGDLMKPGSELLWEKMRSWRKAGRVKKIGVSVYDPEDTKKLAILSPEIVQLPMNFLDQRFLASGELKRLKASGVEIHVRSLFLQGVLLMNPDSVPAHFDSIRPLLAKIRASAARENLDAKRACFAWLEKQKEIDAVVLGVTTPAEWRELLASAENRSAQAARWSLPSETWAQTDARLINPSMWPKKGA